MAAKKTKKTTIKRIKKGETVTWMTNGRWGKRKRKGTVKAFIPRGESAINKLKLSDHGRLVGSDVNTVSDRYLVEIVEDGKKFFQTPRSTSFEG